MADAAAAPAEGEAPAAPKKGMMIGLLVAGIAVGGGVGTFVVAPKLVPPVKIAAEAGAEHGEGEEAKSEEGGEGEHGKKGEGEGAAPKMVTLDNIIVNPAGSQGSRFLMTSVAIATEDEKLETALRDRQVELRDKVTTVLEVMTMQQLTGPGARDSVKIRVQAMVVQMLGGKPKVKVFIPQFVIQ